MKGKLIHTEHRSSDISEYYFNSSTMLITEVKNLRYNKTKEYKYSIEQFSKSNQGSKIEKQIINKANTLVNWLIEVGPCPMQPYRKMIKHYNYF